MSDTYRPIPGMPGYSVNAKGQVRSSRSVLPCDSQGRVLIRRDGKACRHWPVDLMLLAGHELRRGALDEQEELILTRAQLDDAQRTIRELQGRCDNLTAKATRLSAQKPPQKRGVSEDTRQLKTQLTEARARATKLEKQRDNLAMRLLAYGGKVAAHQRGAA